MRFKKTIHLLAILFVAATLAPVDKLGAQGFYFYNDRYYESQTVFELGVQAGALNCMTDLGGSKKGKSGSGFANDLTLKNTNFTAGLFLSATYKDFLAARLDMNFGKIEAADSTLAGTENSWAKGRYDRNLSVRSSIFELALNVEIHPFFVIDYVYGEPPRWSPYLSGGIGYFKFNPQANLNGKWHDLRPLTLEGQGWDEYPDREPYRNWAFSFPLGIGVRYECTQLLTLRAEVARHLTSTDYLDDVSQGDWVDPALFYKYLSPSQANVATQLYNRSPTVNPPRNTRPRGDNSDKDAFWNFVIKASLNLSRKRM
jgi:opacity protein-like surface antigen